MPQAHLYAQWRETVPPLQLDLEEAEVSNGTVRVGDRVRELPAPHHIQPCACTLCRERPEEERVMRVSAIGSRSGTVYLVLPGGIRVPGAGGRARRDLSALTAPIGSARGESMNA